MNSTCYESAPLLGHRHFKQANFLVRIFQNVSRSRVKIRELSNQDDDATANVLKGKIGLMSSAITHLMSEPLHSGLIYNKAIAHKLSHPIGDFRGKL